VKRDLHLIIATMLSRIATSTLAIHGIFSYTVEIRMSAVRVEMCYKICTLNEINAFIVWSQKHFKKTYILSKQIHTIVKTEDVNTSIGPTSQRRI
jgi:hypothetical protein